MYEGFHVIRNVAAVIVPGSAGRRSVQYFAAAVERDAVADATEARKGGQRARRCRQAAGSNRALARTFRSVDRPHLILARPFGAVSLGDDGRRVVGWSELVDCPRAT